MLKTNYSYIIGAKDVGGSADRLSVPVVAVEAKGSRLVEMIHLFNYALEKAKCRFYKGRVYQFEAGSISSYTSA